MSNSAVWLISALVAIIPTVLYVWILWWFDRYEKEPLRLLFAAFFWGALPAAALSIVAERSLVPSLLELGATAGELVSSSLVAPMVEELAKCLAVLLLFWLARGEFDDVLDGVIYGATVGFGFVMTEDVLYFARSLRVGGLQSLAATAFMRSVIFGLNHALFTSVFGAALGYVRTLKRGLRRWTLPPLGLLGAMFLHGLHNLSVSLGQAICFGLAFSIYNNWGWALVIVVVMLVASQREKSWIYKHLQAEVASGLLAQEELEMIGSYRKRLSAQWRALRQRSCAEAGRLHTLAQLATELAFKLEQGDDKRAGKLREQIAALRGGAVNGQTD